MKIIKLITIFGAVIIAGGIFTMNNFGNDSIEYYKKTSPQMEIKEYFNGPIKAWGIVQDWRGRVVRRFDVEMVGEWEGDVGTLTEHFKYYDGKKQERIWTIKKLADGQYQGTAADIIGKAEVQKVAQHVGIIPWICLLIIPHTAFILMTGCGL